MKSHNAVRARSSNPPPTPATPEYFQPKPLAFDIGAVNKAPTSTGGRLLPEDSSARKMFPMGTGVLDYFPDALAAVAEISFKGNQKHNPGQPLHHARGKSMDHADCIVRHYVERGGHDAAGFRHSAQLAWRALALLQEELEEEFALACPRGATPLPPR